VLSAAPGQRSGSGEWWAGSSGQDGPGAPVGAGGMSGLQKRRLKKPKSSFDIHEMAISWTFILAPLGKDFFIVSHKEEKYN
jgi:hypothetical protein